jgi:hypothetical protein
MELVEIFVGLIALFIGASFAFVGSSFLRILFPFVGFFAGFSSGAGMVTAVTGDGFLSTAFSWIVGLFVGMLFALLAYFFYSIAVVLAFAGIGFSIPAAVLALFGLEWNWIAIILGVVVGIVFGLVAMFVQLPVLVLILVSALLGSSIAVYGLLLVFNTADFEDFNTGILYQNLQDNFGLYLLWLSLAIAGMVSQFKIVGAENKMALEFWESSMTYDDLVNSSKSKK